MHMKADNDAEIDDIVDCINFAYNYNDKILNSDNFKDCITLALNNNGEKVDIVIGKEILGYVQVTNNVIDIYMHTS